MERANWIIGGLLLGFAALAIGGCANVKPTRSGYLSDYSQVQADPRNDKLQMRYADSVDLDGFDSFYIEDIAWKSPRPKKIAANPERQVALLQSLRESLQKQLATLKPVVDQPGPRTARVRAAITDQVNASLLLNIPMGIVAVPVSNGGASVEAEVVAPDGRQLAAVIGARAGGLFDVFGYYLPQEHAKQAFRSAARDLRAALVANTSPTNGSEASTASMETKPPQGNVPLP